MLTLLSAAIGLLATLFSPVADLASALKQAAWSENAPFAAIADQAFATVALSKQEAKDAAKALAEWHLAHLREARKPEWTAKSIKIGDRTMKFDYRVFGTKPAKGRSLYISMHGGGGAPAEVNESQWRNQIGLYRPAEGIYLAPRAPTDAWNMWHQSHIDSFFGRIIEDAVLLEGVDPDRVYLMGYSAGGDGVYQLAPRMADRFAAASMMAGHPNDARPDGLRNLPFAIHVGGEDGAFNRNKVAAEWGERLKKLNAADKGGYEHIAKVHAGKGHWMDLQDAEAVPWMASRTRKPWPERVVWVQSGVTHTRFYWLRNAAPVAGERLDVVKDGNTFSVAPGSTVTKFSILLSDDLMDMDKPIIVRRSEADSAALKVGTATRTIRSICESLTERADPAGAYCGVIDVDLGKPAGK